MNWGYDWTAIKIKPWKHSKVKYRNLVTSRLTYTFYVGKLRQEPIFERLLKRRDLSPLRWNLHPQQQVLECKIDSKSSTKTFPYISLKQFNKIFPNPFSFINFHFSSNHRISNEISLAVNRYVIITQAIPYLGSDVRDV